MLSIYLRWAHAADFLDPSVAFRPAMRFVGKDVAELKFYIAEGYYLYRDKISISPVDARIRLLPPQFEHGKLKDDENFGKVEVYYKETLIILRYTNSDAATPIGFRVVAQGCAEAGLCYPPETYYLPARR
jgi:thiol:disulfide interchange protein DsbD